jgi:hypothetical protein
LNSMVVLMMTIEFVPVCLLVFVEFVLFMFSYYMSSRFNSMLWCIYVHYDFRVKAMINLVSRGSFIFMLFVFVYVYWCPTRFPYNMMFLTVNFNTTGVTCGEELPTLPEHLSSPLFLVRFVLLDLLFSV